VRRSLIVRLFGGGRAPATPADLDRAASLGMLGQVPVQGGAAHSTDGYQLADFCSLLGGHAQGEPQCVLCRGRLLWWVGRLWLSCTSAVVFEINDTPRRIGWRTERVSGHVVQLGTLAGVARGSLADGLVGDEVGTSASGGGVLGCGDEELSGGVEVWACHPALSMPLSEDEVDVLALADAKADPSVHLRTHRALSHRLLLGPLGGGNHGDRDGAAEPGDRVGVFGGVGRAPCAPGILSPRKIILKGVSAADATAEP
jgi:hypothetical protein